MSYPLIVPEAGGEQHELGLVASAAEGRFRMERYCYRGHEFTIERRGFTWWCHHGIRIPERPRHDGEDEPLSESYDGWSAVALMHEAGWASLSRRSILRKLRRAIDRELRDTLAQEKLDRGAVFS